jgi:hypothetical protein
MSGIVFFKTKNCAILKDFYAAKLDCKIWLEQKDCLILRHGNFLFGFCERAEIETCGILTFFYENKTDVDAMYKIMKDTADDAPRENEKYKIYQFFAKDPEERMLEFQYFLHPVKEI